MTQGLSARSRLLFGLAILALALLAGAAAGPQVDAAKPSGEAPGAPGEVPANWTEAANLILSYAGLILLTVVFVAPLLWMLSTSFKTNLEATQLPPSWIPKNFTTEAYSTIFRTGESQTPVLRWFLNSMVAASAQTVLVLVTASMAAYALARIDFPGRNPLFAAIITTLFIPQFVFLMPNYLIVDAFGWLDTLLAVIVPGAAGAFGVFFLRQFFVSMPHELEEAALVDGANRFQIFLRIILPLSRAPLATLAVLSFLFNWNDFLWPVYVLLSPENLTLQPGLSILQNAYSTDYAVVMAGGVVASVPILLVFIFAQKYVIQGCLVAVSRDREEIMIVKHPGLARKHVSTAQCATSQFDYFRVYRP